MPLKIIDTEKIKSVVETLKNINVRDLQSMDAADIVNILRRRVDVIVNAVLILVTVVVMAGIAKRYGKKSEALAWEINQRQERLEVSKEAQRLGREHTAFLENFPSAIPTDQLINKLSEFAAARGVRLLSFSPGEEKGDDYIGVIGMHLNISADTYHDIVLFVRDIEDSPYALVVGKWSAKTKEERIKERASETEIQKQTVEADMVIQAVRLKNDEKK